MTLVRRSRADNSPSRFETELQPFIQRLMQTQEIPGLVIAVVQNGRLAYARAFGVKTINPGVVPTIFPQRTKTGGPATTRTLFHMASVTKTFVAMAVLQLVHSGRLDLDRPITVYLPNFKLADPRHNAITVRQLLNHTAGVPDRRGIKGHGWDHPETDDHALMRFVGTLKTEGLEFDPGTRFRYSNVGYVLLGALIERASGESFEAYVHSHILQPLGMNDTSLLLPNRTRDFLATGHETDDAENPMAMSIFPFNRAQSPCGGLESNVLDMTRYAMANLNRGQLQGRRLLPASAYDILWKPAARAEGVGLMADYGSGWYVGTFEGHRVVSHGGKDLGFLSHLALLPDKGVGVVWMMNAGWADQVLSLSEAAMRIALGLPLRPVDVRRDLPKVLAGDLESGKRIDWVRRKYLSLRVTKANNFNFEEQRLDLLGDYLMRGEKVGDAVEVYRWNAEVYPSSTHALTKFGDAQMQAGDNTGAIATYQAALKLDPVNTEVQSRLARLKAFSR